MQFLKKCFVWVFVCWSVVIMAAVAEDGDFYDELDTSPQKKQPSIFFRADRDNPSDQLIYADKLMEQGRNRKAVKQYRALIRTWHDSPEAAQAQYRWAQYLLDRRRYSRAFDEFQYLLDYMPGNISHTEVLETQFRIANALRIQKRARFFFFGGFTAPEQAVPLLEKIVKNGPRWSRTPEVQFMIGAIHEDAKDFLEAANAYEVVLRLYASSDFAAEAGYHRAYCLYRIAKKSPRDETSCRNALSALAAFIRDFPDHDVSTAEGYLDELKSHLANLYYEKAVFYDTIAKRPQSAIIAYRAFLRQFPWSSMAEEVNSRICELEMELETNEEN